MTRPKHCLLLFAALAGPAFAGDEVATLPSEYGDPIQFENITLIPVMSAAVGPFRSYTLLERGLAEKTLGVRELAGSSDEAAVEAVQIRNRGKEPVFLLGGEMILGGKQDRILQADTIVPPDGRWHRVAVFCVEQGRWQGQKMEFSGGGAVAHLKLQEAAMSGSQGRVWEEVAKSNAEHGTTSETQTYRRTIQNAAVRRKIAGYRAELERRMPSAPISGVVFAINGEIQVADLFGNPKLFGDLREKLLSAYILEAIEHQVDPNAKKVNKGEGKGFVEEAASAPAIGVSRSGRGSSTKKESLDSLSSETVDELDGQKVRSTYIKKKKK